MDQQNTDSNLIGEAAIAMAQVLQDVRQLRQRIGDTDVADEHIGFRNLLCGILNCALVDYRSVEIGIKKFVELAAWGTRNLLELKITTDYILASEENALQFQREAVIDAKEFWEAVSKSTKSTHKQFLASVTAQINQEQGSFKEALETVLQRDSAQGAQTTEPDSEAAALKQVLLDIGVKDSAKPIQTGKKAEDLQVHQDFYPFNKLYSKLVHRTALSIASSITQGSLDALVPLLGNSAVINLLSIYDRIKCHVETIGVRLPPKETP